MDTYSTHGCKVAAAANKTCGRFVIGADGHFSSATDAQIAERVQPYIALGVTVHVALDLTTSSVLSGTAHQGVAAAVATAVRHNLSGLMIDYEPRTNYTTAHEQAYASLITAFRVALHAHGLTIDICVSDWSILGADSFGLYARTGLDRMMSMASTYSGLNVSHNQEYVRLEQAAGVSSSQLAVGVGSVSSTPHPSDPGYNWTEAALAAFVQWCEDRGVQSIDLWRADLNTLNPVDGTAPWVYKILANFLSGGRGPAAGRGVAGATMHAIRAKGGCGAPFDCVSLAEVPMPSPKPGQALIALNASSVNPSDVDEVELGGCTRGCGADVAGMVVECPGCSRLREGDAVWSLAEGAFAQFAVAPEAQVGLKPAPLDFAQAGSVPEIGLTSLFSLKRTGSQPGSPLPAGSPWGNTTNLSVAITAGAGGTGYIGIELAKAWGAVHIATATTGPGIPFVESLGATLAVDYKKRDLFDALPDESTDVVFDNYGAEGTADKAMKVLREGGVYLLLPHGECYVTKSQKPPCLSANPKPGVRQLNYDTGPDFDAHALQGLDELKALFEAGELKAELSRSFALADAAAAFNFSAGGGQGGVASHLGKISIAV